MSLQEQLRNLPSVDLLISSPQAKEIIAEYGRETALQTMRFILADFRQQIIAGESVNLDPEAILQVVLNNLVAEFSSTLRPVINATGVILHTNLGRAPLAKSAQHAMLKVAKQYNTLEFDLASGKRGSRLVHAEKLLTKITGAEAALVVNNAASALVLALSTLAQNREVIVSRGQLVEIGGGFRIPEIMQQSGAKLVEVGTTNRTRAKDFQSAITEDTIALLRIHASNFKQIGFIETPSIEELAKITHSHNQLLIDDIGSGTLLPTEQFGLAHEPMVQDSVKAGSDLVIFSGDKLLGGPQAGILVGKKEIIQQLKSHPLARALRVDKLIYAALFATLQHYLRDEVIEHIPIWQMISRSASDIQKTAQIWAEKFGAGILSSTSMIGGGSLPGTTLPTYVVAVNVTSPEKLMHSLRMAEIPIIARIEDNRILFDPRTILPDQEEIFLKVVRSLLTVS